MAEFSMGFNFDGFDETCREAIKDAEIIELAAKRCIEEDEEVLRRPGEIGSVICTPLYKEWAGDELPPDDAA